MGASKNSTEQAGSELIENLWEGIKSLTLPIRQMNNQNIIEIRDLMTLAVHRLTWLELVVKGLTFAEQHDAAHYAKFVLKKKNLEDLDIEELKMLLRDYHAIKYR